MENLSGKTLKVAVIGLGKMGLLHASILNVLPNVEVTAICDKSTLIRKISKKIFHGVQIEDDIGKLSSLDLDAVYITTPISSHSFIASNIYLDKIASNVFVEKTLASSYDEARKLCELARSFGGTNMVGYMKRFSVIFRKAKDLLDKETIGKVNSFEAYAYSSDFLGNETSAARGGALRDLGCHAIDLAIWFFGDLEVNSAKLQAENYEYFKVKNSDGLEGTFKISQRMSNYRMPEIGLSIRGSKGILMVNDDKVNLKMDDGKSSTWYRHVLEDNVPFCLGEPEYFREDEHFVKSVLGNYSAEPNFYTASKIDYLIDRVQNEADEK